MDASLELIIELTDLLAKATSHGVVNWLYISGDCYRSVVLNKIYHLHWLYWYNQDGITLDRQGLIIAFNQQDIVLPWGTVGIESAKKILDAIDIKWSKYNEGI